MNIVNFIDKDFPEDAGFWKPAMTYPVDNVKVDDIDFIQSPSSDQVDALLFDPTGMSPWIFSTRCGLGSCSITLRQKRTDITSSTGVREPTVDAVSIIYLLFLISKCSCGYT